MVLLTRKLPASTLVEVIVAMLIILISFGAALTVIDSNTRATNSSLLIQANQQVLKLKDETLSEHRFLDETIDVGNLHLVKTIYDIQGASELKLLEIQAFSGINDKPLIVNREIIIAE